LADVPSIGDEDGEIEEPTTGRKVSSMWRK